MLLWRRDTARFAALAVVAFIVTAVWQPGVNVIETTRSFFGVHRVVETSTGTHRILHHGTTIHGAERVREADGTPVTGRPEPLAYYYFGGPISDGVAGARAAQGGLKTVAVVGLGTGASRAIARRARTGPSSRSTRRWCGSRATRPGSASCPNARPAQTSCSATRG